MWELSEVQYFMELGRPDTWRIFGYTNRPGFSEGVFTSPPVAFDEQTDVLTTLSGSQYKIVSYAKPREEVIKQIREDIAMGGFEIH